MSLQGQQLRKFCPWLRQYALDHNPKRWIIIMTRKLNDRINRLETATDHTCSYVIKRVIIGPNGQPDRLYSRTKIKPGHPPQVEQFDMTGGEIVT